MFFSVDDPLIPSNRVDPNESVTQPPSGLLPTWVDEPQIHSSCEADRTGMHVVSDDEGSFSFGGSSSSISSWKGLWASGRG